jgi:ribosomal protein L16 Arg81 hydroxylase
MVSYAQELVSSVSSLEDLLSPVRNDDFIDRYFGKRFLHVPGPKGKFSSLLPWNELNRILEEHRLGPSRFKLFRTGKQIPADKYLSAPDGIGPHLRAAELTNFLAQGATLIVDAFDELYKPVRELAVALERIFRIRVGANLYAGWRTDQGFLLHYDKHDTVILQVAGRKHWKIYRPTRLYPLEQERDAEPAETPTDEPIWDEVLEDGELLYIPRGWWHVAYPIDEPTLHLTFRLSNHRGLDLLLWFANGLNNCVEVRQDIPHLADRDTQMAYLEQLRKHLFSAWSDDLIDRYLSSADTIAVPRPHLQLPEAATPEGIVVRRKSQVRLTEPRRLNLSGKPENGNLKFRSSGKTLHCSVLILPALERLNDGQFHSVQELSDLVPDQNASVINFLQALALQGILYMASERDSNSSQK